MGDFFEYAIFGLMVILAVAGVAILLAALVAAAGWWALLAPVAIGLLLLASYRVGRWLL